MNEIRETKNPSSNEDTSTEVLEQSEIGTVNIIEMENMCSGAHDEPPTTKFSRPELQKFASQVKLERESGWPRLNAIAATNQALEVYNRCVSEMTHNITGPRVSLANDMNIEAWKEISTSHPDDWWIIECIEYGFPLQYRGPALNNAFMENHPSAVNFPSQVRAYIGKELPLGGLVGPFDDVPFTPWCNLAPIMTREKANNKERRIIVDLSFPEDNGPNSFIEKNTVFGRSVNHSLPSVNDAVKVITSMDFNVVLCTVDIARAYRNFKVDPLDWPLTCITFDNKYYVDTCMPFGSRVSSLYMQRMACCIQRALINLNILSVVYLDDLLIICKRNEQPEEQFAVVLAMLRRLGLPIAWEKVVGPARSLRFLGVIIDVDRQEIRMPREKIDKFLKLIDDIYDKRYITK